MRVFQYLTDKNCGDVCVPKTPSDPDVLFVSPKPPQTQIPLPPQTQTIDWILQSIVGVPKTPSDPDLGKAAKWITLS